MNEQQRRALEIVKAGHNVYIGGVAGTGKSFVVKEIVEWARSEGRQTALTCTTGIACSVYSRMNSATTLHKWGGLGDGRLTTEELVSAMDTSDGPAERIRGVDLLVIDEISMLSKVMFEKLERVMRHVRGGGNVNFGGVQVVLVGDFLQLPPIRNTRYNDNGEYCFQSDMFPVHKLFLKEVIRQSEQEFIGVLQAIAKGNLDDSAMDFVKNLSRPLPYSAEETTRIFSINILADIYNRDNLMRLPGDIFSFESDDEGEQRHLSSLTVQKTLWLKNNAKVMLLRNLSDHLVNGLCGTVVGLREGEVDVFFPTLDTVSTITRKDFAVYDPATKRNLAVRNQVPLKLCYGITVHKAQGMTLNRVEVDCRRIFLCGQLAVAMGRVKSSDSLRVVNFSKDVILPQPAVVLQFLESEWRPVQLDLSCCQIRLEPAIPRDDARDEGCGHHHQPDDCDIDFSSEFDDEIDDIILNVDLDSLQEVGNITEEQTYLPLPGDLNLEEEIHSLKIEEPTRESQVVYNAWIDYLLNHNAQLRSFCERQYTSIVEMFNLQGDSHTQKEQTASFKSFQAHLTSEAYKTSVLNLMPGETEHVDVVYNLCYDVMSILRKCVSQQAAAKLPVDDTCQNLSKRHVGNELTDTAKGKIRYIGGYTVAKLVHRTNLSIQRSAFKHSKVKIEQYELAKKSLMFLHSITCSELSETTYPETLKETARKQNISRGLTNISDSAYKFFETLISTGLSELNGENLNTYGTDLHPHVNKCVKESTQIHRSFVQMMCQASSTEQVSFDGGDIEDNVYPQISACLDDLTFNAYVINELFDSVVDLCLKVLFSQFSRDVVTALKLKKKMEHRKQVRVSDPKSRKQSKSDTVKQVQGSGPKSRKQTKGDTVSKRTKKVSKNTEQQEPVPSTSGLSKCDKLPVDVSPETSKEDDDVFCPKCNKLYVEGDDWICCDSCNQWFDRSCAKLRNNFKWKKFSKPGVSYFCHDCQ